MRKIGLILAGLSAIVSVSCTDPLIDGAKKIRENYGNRESAPLWYFRDGDNSCFFMFKRNGENYWSDFFKITEMNLGAEKVEELREEKPQEGGLSLYPRDEMIKACHQIDRNPVNGNSDGVAVPEETKSTLNYLRYKKTL